MVQGQQTKASKSKRLELILQQLDGLPTLPAIAARLLQLTVRDNTQASEVVSLLESDPALASKIITLVTRGESRLRRQSASVSKAVVLLGFDAVRSAVLSIKVFETLSQGTDEFKGPVDRSEFWKHSLSVACAAKMLSPHLDPRIDPEEAFLCGLLHDMGKAALDAALPRSYARVVQITEDSLANIADVERRVLGVDHCLVGKRLAQRWLMPESVVETVWLHQQGVRGLPEAIRNRRMVQIVHIADVLSREQRIGYSGNHGVSESAVALAEELGCKRDTIEKISRGLRGEISERGGLLGLDAVAPEELYHEAVGDANIELGRLNDRLRLQNHRLQVRSKFFELLCSFGDSLRETSSVSDVCQALTSLWQKHTGCRACGVYAAQPEDSLIEGAVTMADGGETTPFVVDRDGDVAVHGAVAEGAGFAIAAAGENDGWFFEQVAPGIAMDKTLTMPLRVAEETVGVLLWETSSEAEQYSDQLQEMQAFASDAALALRQQQQRESQAVLCEQLAEVNLLLQQSQQELLRKRSLAAVGEMACGAAHEMNNPLAIVVGRAQLLAGSEEDAKRKEMLEAIERHGRDASDIITELLSVAQATEPNRASVNVREVIGDAVRMCEEKAEVEGIKIEAQLPSDLPDVNVDATQMALALAELVSNSIFSYGEPGGVVKITASCDDWQEKVIIKVSDNGCGMDADVLDKAFAPFFSARPAGRGRGLGLTRCNQLIDSNGGTVTLASESDGGTCAKVELSCQAESESDDVADEGVRLKEDGAMV